MKIRQLLWTCVLVPLFTINHLEASSSFSDSISNEVTPLEDLMSEHGVLNRVMLIYEEVIRRIDNHQKFPPRALKKSAEIIRDLIEEHHEKLEEKYIFTPLEEAGILVDEIKILREQHVQGRILTKYIIEHSTQRKLIRKDQRIKMKRALVAFITMYRPHEAREDTVIFPALSSLLTEQEYAELGEIFEEEEHKHFGDDPLERFVDMLAEIEKKLGIYELGQFTPK